MKNTVIVGASTNPGRYAQLAASMLKEYQHPIILLGVQEGEIYNEPILNIKDKPAIPDVDTITLYVSPKNQEGWYDYLLSLNPKRIIFNPGTENEKFMRMAEDKKIETVEGCTLVMLRTNQF